MKPFTMPKTKLPLDQADDKDLRFWLQKKETDLEAGQVEPNFMQWTTGFIAALKTELARRNGGAPANGTNGAAKPAAQSKPAAPPVNTGALAVRATDKLSGSFSDANEANQALKNAVSQYNLVSPATHCGMLPEGCGVAISLVHIDTTKVGNAYPAGDVNELAGKLMLSGNALKRIAAAASLDWDPTLSGRLDNGDDPRYCHFRAVGWVKNFDGSRRKVCGEVDIDTRPGGAAEVEIRTKAAARAKEKPNWVNDGGDSQLLELRKFLLRHCETKAKLRAIADMGVKRAYTKEELEKPFAVARLMWTGQTKDPELRKLFAEKQMDSMLGSSAALYGQQAPASPGGPLLPMRGHAPPPLGESAGGYEPDDTDYIDAPQEPPSEPKPAPAPQASPAGAAGPTPPAAAPAAETNQREPGDDEDYPT